MIEEIQLWLHEAGERIKEAIAADDFDVEEKSGRADLVTTVDKATQDFLIKKILAFDPEAKILAEEEGRSTIDSMSGRVFIIDPIDGTLNFVLEQENFCIMLGIYEDGVGQLGFLYDVMKGELYWGGKGYGVYRNKEKLTPPANKELSAGLIGVNGYMYAHNRFHTQELGEESMGVRMSGCAGLEMIAMLKGNHIGYISSLAPWDYAPGCVLLEEFGIRYSNEQGEPMSFDGRERFFAGTPAVFQRYMALLT